MQCDSCIQPGFYGFPMCQRCDCHPTGTDPHHSNGGHCNQQDGQCPCKANVMGRRCDTCKESTFGLLQVASSSTETEHQEQMMTKNSFNDGGCTPCFCFGRSSSCTQAQLFWSQVEKIQHELSPSLFILNLLSRGKGRVVIRSSPNNIMSSPFSYI